MALNILILGSNSEIAQAFLSELITGDEDVSKIYLSTSDISGAEKYATHLQVRYGLKNVPIHFVPYNALTDDAEEIFGHITDVNLVFSAMGFLGKGTEHGFTDIGNTRQVMSINYSGLAEVLTVISRNMIAHHTRGQIMVLSSVAGERGRQSNFVYGSAKAGLTAFLSGLRNYLHRHHIHVMTVLPGFMATKMTAGMPLNPRLTLQPEQAGKLLYKAFRSRRNVVYMKGVWRYIMLIIRNIPEFIFKKMTL